MTKYIKSKLATNIHQRTIDKTKINWYKVDWDATHCFPYCKCTSHRFLVRGNKIVFQNDLMGSLKFKRVKTSCGLASCSNTSLTLLVLAELFRLGDITTRNSGVSAQQAIWAQYCKIQDNRHTSKVLQCMGRQWRVELESTILGCRRQAINFALTDPSGGV